MKSRDPAKFSGFFNPRVKQPRPRTLLASGKEPGGSLMDKKRILIADDEPAIRAVTWRMLEQDYVVLEATNGEEAVEIATEQKPDLILMDLMMPEMDGYAACSLIKADQATKMIPVIILTAIGHEFNRSLLRRWVLMDT
jgi:CheY-like chemotaxis protein